MKQFKLVKSDRFDTEEHIILYDVMVWENNLHGITGWIQSGYAIDVYKEDDGSICFASVWDLSVPDIEFSHEDFLVAINWLGEKFCLNEITALTEIEWDDTDPKTRKEK